ncbi:hypothetical protein [Nocardia wallacei]|uniref:hypothetical protein n=1 Tax=Nocardia wallacei TaxID=480035 RepID=UPI002458E55C|nr:hypothetical protein [Nocardia wallacei]
MEFEDTIACLAKIFELHGVIGKGAEKAVEVGRGLGRAVGDGLERDGLEDRLGIGLVRLGGCRVIIVLRIRTFWTIGL